MAIWQEVIEAFLSRRTRRSSWSIACTVYILPFLPYDSVIRQKEEFEHYALRRAVNCMTHQYTNLMMDISMRHAS